jgi:hypothetical protein
MPDLSAPISDCIKPPCLTVGQVVEGAVYLLAAVVILVLIIVVFTRVLGGKLRPAAPEDVSPSGAYELNSGVMRVLDRLPRPWRDETFYEQLQADGPTLTRAAVIVVMLGLVLAAPSLVWEASAGRAGEGLQRVFRAGTTALILWIMLTTVAVGVARLLFGRRTRWPLVLAGLAFAASPMVLLVLASVPIVGLVVAFAAVSWALVLCYLAIRETVGSDEMQAVGITLSMVVATFLLWSGLQFSAGRPAGEPTVVCDGLVDSSGACVPMEQLPPSVQTAIAVP